MYTTFTCPMDYQPRKTYTRQELIALIESSRQLLCFFAAQTGEKRCAIGVDFDGYDRQNETTPVHIIPDRVVKQALIPAEGKAFAKAYQDSQIGQKVIVTFTSRAASGWFEMGWEDSE
jgi:hypothetical protein